MKVGAQLYNVRDYCKDTESLSETLKRLADMGYRSVQISGTCDCDGDWLNEELKKNGLIAPLTHVSFDKLAEKTDRYIEEHKKFGCKYIGIGAMPGLWDKNKPINESLSEFVSKAGAVAEKIKDADCYFMYHNHDREYLNKTDDGRTYMEYLSDTFSADIMGFTLDTYWVKHGGYEPVSEIKRLSGRLPCVHFKDMAVEDNGERRFTWCGNGILDFAAIGDALKAAGTEYIFIEQDKTFDDEPDPFKCLEKSKKYLESVGFEF